MFYGAEVFNQPIGDWDVSNVTNMIGMFVMGISKNHYLLLRLLIKILADWDVSNVTDMNYMFYRAEAFNQPIGDWDVSNVTDMSNMFSCNLLLTNLLEIGM